MKILIALNRAYDDQVCIANLLADSMRVCGDVPTIEHIRSFDVLHTKLNFNAVVVWGWRIGRQFYEKGINTLVIERGYVADRFHWYSAGWNGLNGRAKFPACNDSGLRWGNHFNDLIKPWRDPKDGSYALVLGQVPTDTSLRGVDFKKWANSACEAMQARGYPVTFRPHPIAANFKPTAKDVQIAGGTLENALNHAIVAVTYNSNAGVDAALAGVSVIATDAGAMAWDVAAHHFTDILVQPDRTKWAHALAWRQWQIEEFAQPSTWGLLKSVITT